MPAETVVVQAFRPAVSGRPEGLHYFRRFLHRLFTCMSGLKVCTAFGIDYSVAASLMSSRMPNRVISLVRPWRETPSSSAVRRR